VSGAERASAFREESLTAYCLDVTATALAEEGDGEHAAVILGATERVRERLELDPDGDEAAMRQRALEAIRARPPSAEVEARLVTGTRVGPGTDPGPRVHRAGRRGDDPLGLRDLTSPLASSSACETAE
jgi:hypothetical protein